MKLFSCATLLMALSGACHLVKANDDWATVPDEGLLVDVAPAERTRVSDARVTHGKANDRVAAAEREYELAVAEQTAAKQQHGVAVDKVVWAETAVANAKTTGTVADVEEAQQQLQIAKDVRDVHIARCELRDRQVIEAEMQTELAEAQLAVADAELDLAKVVAVNTLARPEMQKPDIGTFEAVVRGAEGKENIARASLAAASREVEIGRSKLQDRERDAR